MSTLRLVLVGKLTYNDLVTNAAGEDADLGGSPNQFAPDKRQSHMSTFLRATLLGVAGSQLEAYNVRSQANVRAHIAPGAEKPIQRSAFGGGAPAAEERHKQLLAAHRAWKELRAISLEALGYGSAELNAATERRYNMENLSYPRAMLLSESHGLPSFPVMNVAFRGIILGSLCKYTCEFVSLLAELLNPKPSELTGTPLKPTKTEQKARDKAKAAYALTLDEAADELWSCAEFKASASNMVAATLDRLCLGFKSLDSRFLDVNDGTHKMFLQLKHGDVLLPRLEHDYERCMVKRLAVLHGSELGTNVEVSVLMDMFIGENVGLSEYITPTMSVYLPSHIDNLTVAHIMAAAPTAKDNYSLGYAKRMKDLFIHLRDRTASAMTLIAGAPAPSAAAAAAAAMTVGRHARNLTVPPLAVPPAVPLAAGTKRALSDPLFAAMNAEKLPRFDGHMAVARHTVKQ